MLQSRQANPKGNGRTQAFGGLQYICRTEQNRQDDTIAGS